MRTWQQWFQTARRSVALAVALGVPLAIYLVNGTLEPWMFILGIVAGFSCWYFFPFIVM